MVQHSDADIEAALERLQAAGTLDESQAVAMRQELAAGSSKPSAAGNHVATLIVTNWQDLSTAGRLLIFISLTAGLVALGAMLEDRLDVARGLAWVIAVPCAGGMGAAIAGRTDAESESAFLVAATMALACAAVLLVFVGALFVATGVLLLALGGLVTLGGIHLLADEELGLAVVIAGALCTFAYYRAATAEPAGPLVLATVTIASVTPRMLNGWFDDSAGGSGILAFTGLAVLLAVALHVRLGRRQSMRRSSAR